MPDRNVADEQPALVVLRAEDRPLNWGSEREMNGIETLMWRAEADPRPDPPLPPRLQRVG